jgi:hypothetical protein
MSSSVGFPQLQQLTLSEGADWQIVETLDEQGSRAYYYKRRLAIRHELDSDQAKRLAGLKLIEKDLRTIKSWLPVLSELLSAIGVTDTSEATLLPRALKESTQVVTARALVIAIVTTYGKLFSAADGRRVKLEAQQVPAERLETHAYLLSLRNEFTAHAGRGHESSRAVLAIDYSPENRVEPHIFIELGQPAFLGLPGVRKVEELVDALHAHAETALAKAASSLYAQLRKEFTPEKLRFLRMGAPGTLLRRDTDK